MANDIGAKERVLPTGRISYGMAGTSAVPLKVDSDGVLAGIATTISKTIQTELLSPQLLAASTQLKSTTLSLTGVKSATFFIDHGRASTAAFGTNGTEYRIEASEKDTGNDTWRPVASVIANSAACNSIMTGTALAAAVTTIAVVSTTTMVVGDIFVFANTTSAASIEWCKVTSVTGTASFTILDGLTNVQASTQVMYNGGQYFPLLIDAKALTRARVVVNNNASGTTLGIYTRVACITEA